MTTEVPGVRGACPARPVPATQPCEAAPAGPREGPCSPSVRVPVAVHVPSPRAAWSRTLEDVLVHGEDLAGGGGEKSAASQHGRGRTREPTGGVYPEPARLRPAPTNTRDGRGRESPRGREGRGLHRTLIGRQGGVRCGGGWRSGTWGPKCPGASGQSPALGARARRARRRHADAAPHARARKLRRPARRGRREPPPWL